MAPKRKRSSTENDKASRAPSILPQSSIHLVDLPFEILEVILSQVIPDARGMHAIKDAKASAKLYTTPILQSSKAIRQQGLDIVNKRTIWICISVNTRENDRISRYLASFPIIPPKFQYYIADSAPRVHLAINQMEGGSAPRTRAYPTDQFVFPYNMGTLLPLCGFVSQLALEGIFRNVTIRYDNMTDRSWDEVNMAIMPALLGLRDLYSCTVSSQTCSGLAKIPFWPVSDAWTLVDMIEKVMDVLDQASNLVQAARHAEADMFLLYNGWLLDRAALFVPAPEDWALGRSDPFESGGKPDVFAQARCAWGNELRTLLFELEHRACLAYSRFVENYGLEWCKNHQWDIQHGIEEITSVDYRFLGDPEFTWFGISQTDQARLHHSRAQLHYAYRNIDMSEGIPPYLLDLVMTSTFDPRRSVERAAIEMCFARLIDPSNTTYEELYHFYMERLTESAQEDVEVEFQDRKVTHCIPRAHPDESDVVWNGDADMLAEWGDEDDILPYLPDAQKLLGLSLPEMREELIKQRARISSSR